MMIDRDKSGKKNNQPETNSSHQPDPKPPRKPKWRWRFLRWGGSLLLVSLGGGLVYGWFFVQNQLVPLIETELIDLLNRPVKMGSLQRFSLTGVRFGATKILATPTDPAKVSVAAVEVGFNPFVWLTSGELQLDVTAIQPDVYLEQGKNRRWLLTKFDSPEKKKKRFNVSLETLRLQDADVILRARSQTGNLQSPVKVLIDSGEADFLDKGKIIEFDLSGKLANGGDLQVSGTGMLKTEAINLVLRGNDIQATDVGNLLPLPFALQAGTIGANLEVRIRPQQIARIQGIATLDTVTARLPTLTQPFTQSNGILRFRETEIYLENVASRFGSIPAIANGIVDLQKGYNLKAKTEPIQVQQVIEALKLKKPPVPIVGELKADIRVTGSTPQPGQPLTSPVVSVDAITTQKTRIDRVDFRPGSTAQLQLIGSNLSVNQFQATPTVGGKLTGKGKVNVGAHGVRPSPEAHGVRPNQNSEFKFDVNAINVPAGAIARLYQTTLPINPGLVSGRAQFLGNLENPEQLKATGAATFKLGDGSVSASNFQYANRRWQGNIQASGVNLTNLNPALPSQVHQGRLNGIFNVSGGIDSFAPESIRATGSANVAIANGTVNANNITLANGRWVTTVKAQGIDSDRILPNLPSQFTGILNGTFDLAGSTHTSLQNIRGNGTANLTLPQGKIEAENIQLANGEFKAVVRPNEVALKQFYKEGRGTVDGKLNIFGNLEKPALADVRASGELTFSQGVGALVRPLTTAIDWNGQRLNIRQAIATGIKASGWADIAPELLGTPKAIKQFELQVAASEVDVKAFAITLPDNIAKVSYSGNLDFDGTIAGTLQSPRIEGDLNLDKLQVASLEFDRTLKGTVKGIPEQGINIDLAGIQDRIQLALDPKYQPTSFAIELDRMNVSGDRKNNLLQIEANNIQVGLFKNIAKASQITLPEAILSQPLSGELSGNFAYNLQTSELSGEDVAIANPHLGTLKGDRITSNFRYFNNNLTLKNARFQKNDSQYLLKGSLINIQSNPQLQAEITVSKGQIQDVLQTLQIFDLSDLTRGLNPPYAKAADLYEGRNQDAPVGANGRSPVPQSGIQKSPYPPDSRTDAIYRVSTPQTPLFNIGTPQASILEQLSRLSEIETLLRMQRKKRQEASPLPELAELQGTFDGKLTVSAAPKSDIKASFDFQGKAWQWRNYAFNQIDLKGGLQDGIVTLEPVRVQSGESLFAFSGSVGGKIPSGRLQLNNIPLELLSEFVEVPPTIAIGGLLNGNVTLAGSRDNPQANGELAIANATINQTALSTTQGSFTYDKSRLDFQASSKLNPQAEPIVIQGSIPYQLPFATVKSDSDCLQLNLQVQNEGMALLDILSRDALSWIDGKGEIAIDISGRFDQKQGRPNQLRAEGIATFNNATIGAQVLPNAPLTEVNGKILFNFDRVDVENLTGKFSGGKIAVAGSLPLIQSKPQKNPLTVTLDNLALNLKGLYQGGVQGQVKIAGSAFEPDIGGRLALSNGRVLLEEGNGTESGLNGGLGLSSTEFNNLQIMLGQNIQLVRPPILNFLATGSLTLNGNLYQPRPQGKITLENGQVNLFASQLRLDTGEENTAQFSPKRGLDPYLKLQLRTSATETTRDAVRTNASSSEIADPLTANLDSLQTVRIRARIEGYASQLTNSIELTSIPPRSQREIVTLLGGGFVNTLGRGDTTLGLANLAGSAVFGSIQGAISDRLGLSEFRIFSTPLIDDRDRTSNNGIGIAAEAGIDITKDVSFSVLKILNTDRLPQFGLDYRVNNNTVIRGSSNFSDDSRVTIEYEQRF